VSKMLRQPIVGQRLRGLREHAGLTRAALSAETGVPVTAIARLESGKNVRLSTYLPIMAYFADREPQAWMLVDRLLILPAKRRDELLAMLDVDGVPNE
jgi:transcriptional regulator with XRE-family HTH domain